MNGRAGVLLFEWQTGGHFSLYVRRFAEALMTKCRVVVAAPDQTCEEIADLPVETLPLGDARIPIGGLSAVDVAAVVEEELALFEASIARSRVEQAAHLYTERVLRRLVTRSPLPVPVTICVFRPRIHYPWRYRTMLPPSELARAAALEERVRRWRRRPDANAVMTLDENVASRWSRSGGAPARWLPEPPVGTVPDRPPVALWDCCVYGALAERKGVGLLANAVAGAEGSLRVLLAGAVENGYERAIGAHVQRMEFAGAHVELRGWSHGEHEGLTALATSRSVLLPYVGHYGMSRVLVESAAVGTPVLADRRGLIGHLTRRWNLGATVDCRDPRAFRAALGAIVEGEPSEGQRAALSRFALRYSRDSFECAVTEAFGL